MSWAGDLARCLQAVQQDPGVLAALPPSPRVVHSQISLHVLDVALRYDPAAESPSNAVASVLLIGGLKWGSTTGIQTQVRPCCGALACVAS